MSRETESFSIRRRIFFTIASQPKEYMQNVIVTLELIEELRRKKVDILSFLERKWCCPIAQPSESWSAAEDNIAILHVQSYDEWWKNIGKKTRNMVRKAEKAGVETKLAKANDTLAEGIWRIFNETPIRQERSFPHYGISLEVVKKNLLSIPNSTYIGAYFQNELIGFIHLVHGDRLTLISQILSMQKHLDKSLNNVLIAKAVEFCSENHIEWIMYGRMGNHPTLDSFKESNGFTKLQLTRFFIPLTRKGRLAIKLGLHQELKNSLPPNVKKALFPIYNWVSRTRVKIKLILKPRPIR